MAQLAGSKSEFSHKKRGAVIAVDNRVLATGVSSHLESTNTGATSNPEERYVATVNAEIVAIGSAVRANMSLADATIYVSDCPNWNVFKILVTLGIKRIVHYGPNTNERITHYASSLGVSLVAVG